MQLIKRHQAGETIIEVLIALSVFGMALGISYASAARSLRASRDALERTQASQLAQSTVEVIRAYASYNIPAIDAKLFPTADTRICVSADMAVVAARTPPADADSDGNCPISDGLYRPYVDVHPLGSNAYEYAVHVVWDSLRSENDGQVVMRYKWVRITP